MITTTKTIEEPKQIALPKHYFINERVEWAISKYAWTGCTSIALRDEVMANASELIRQIIRKQGLHTIYPGHEESAFGDLLQTAWCQIERVLYKYRANPHCRKCYNPDRPADSLLYKPKDKEYGIKTMEEVIAMHKRCPKCRTKLAATPIVEPKQGLYGGSETILFRGTSKVFNLWSQVARTVILAYIKKEGRDRKNSGTYSGHLAVKPKPVGDIMQRFLTESKSICQFNKEYLDIIDAIEWLMNYDERPHDGLISKIIDRTRLSRTIVTDFMRFIKLRSFDFSDSPLSKGDGELQIDKRKSNTEAEDESWD